MYIFGLNFLPPGNIPDLSLFRSMDNQVGCFPAKVFFLCKRVFQYPFKTLNFLIKSEGCSAKAGA
jgi:hypothetical protein